MAPLAITVRPACGGVVLVQSTSGRSHRRVVWVEAPLSPEIHASRDVTVSVPSPPSPPRTVVVELVELPWRTSQPPVPTVTDPALCR